MKTSSLILPCFAVLLSGCLNDNKPVQTVDWYKTHHTERAAMISECDNNPGQLALTPNCVNAHKADEMQDAQKTGVTRLGSVMAKGTPSKPPANNAQ